MTVIMVVSLFGFFFFSNIGGIGIDWFRSFFDLGKGLGYGFCSGAVLGFVVFGLVGKDALDVADEALVFAARTGAVGIGFADEFFARAVEAAYSPQVVAACPSEVAA